MFMYNSVEYDIEKAFAYYPSSNKIDSWATKLRNESAGIQFSVEFMDYMPVKEIFGNGPNALVNRYIKFTLANGHSFYAYWQPAHKTPAPLLINLPGYGSYISMHPQICDDGYNILHISPLGYVTPTRIMEEIQLEDGNWPVLANTAAGQPGGYRDWLLDCLIAIRWAASLPEVMSERISLFGTSQGGGGSLLLASVLQGNIRCVCADLPFLTAFPLSMLAGEAYGILQNVYSHVPEQDFWNRLGYIDTISHAHRLHLPVMLSSGGQDTVCPPESVKMLFEKLNTTKQYTYLANNIHTHSRESMFLFRSWIAMFA